MEKKKNQDQQFLTFEYYSDWQPSLFRSLCKNNTKIEGKDHFSHYRVNSSCEQVVATHWPFLHMQCSIKPLTVVTISALQRLVCLNVFFHNLKACLFPNAKSIERLLDQK